MSRSSRGSSYAGVLCGIALAVGCARILGIEDAECDPTYSRDCLSDETADGNGGNGPTQAFPGLNPAAGGSSGLAGAGGTGAGAGGSGGAAGSSMVASAGAAGSGSMTPDPIVERSK